MRAGNANITQDANRIQHRGRMSRGEALGSLNMAQGAHGAGQTGRRQAGTSGVRNVEIVTLDDSESDGETLEEMEEKLAKMIQRRLGRKRSHQGKYNLF